MVKQKNETILVEVRRVMRVGHYSIHTERSYCNWIKRFIIFHKVKDRAELFIESEKKSVPSVILIYG